MTRGASLAGFEPATRCLEGSRSIQLSYRDMMRRQIKFSNGSIMGQAEGQRSQDDCIVGIILVRSAAWLWIPANAGMTDRNPEG